MPIVRAAGLAVCAAATLAGCVGHRLATEAPAGTSLAGSWRLDRAASDDPDKVLGKLRTQALRLMGRRPVAPGPGPGARGAGRQTADVGGEYDSGAQEARGELRADPLLRSPMARIISKSAARGDFLTVRQTATEFVLDYGNTQRRFTPGQRSVVSTEGGVGDQTTGWKGREYVIELKAQMGPSVTERYSLSSDGKRLIEKLHIGPAELPAVELTRLYNPTSEAAPRQLPVTD